MAVSSSMVTLISQLSSVHSRLVQAAGAGRSRDPVTGWLIGTYYDDQLVITSVLQRCVSTSGATLDPNVGMVLLYHASGDGVQAKLMCDSECR